MSINSGMFSSATDAHNTPMWLVKKVDDFLGGIMLDPCTSIYNPCGASRYFTEQDDGLGQVWRAKSVYMNPPYGREIGNWTYSLVDNFARGHIDEAIALLPARTDTKWWQDVATFPALFIKGRLRFNDCGQSAPFPSALIYLGDNWQEFKAEFEDIGTIYMPMAYVERIEGSYKVTA